MCQSYYMHAYKNFISHAVSYHPFRNVCPVNMDILEIFHSNVFFLSNAKSKAKYTAIYCAIAIYKNTHYYY
uniref:Uncharacterized protein n=1 Tax=Anguilla anguilla TaxID=7936 RepID=A0A0E9U9F4_ANGAN